MPIVLHQPDGSCRIVSGPGDAFGNRLHRPPRVANANTLESADPRLSPVAVVDWLRPLVSEPRRRRIRTVLGSRLASVTVVMERLYDPHNGSAVLRTCEALGLIHVHVVEGDTPFFCAGKVSQNAHKWLTIHIHPTIERCLSTLQQVGFETYAALPPPLEARRGETTVVEVERPVALVFGNEHAGLTHAAVARCQRRFSLPMYGFTESLNLSVSVALSVADVAARRRVHIGAPGDLDSGLRKRLEAGCYAASTRHAARVVLRRLQGR